MKTNQNIDLCHVTEIEKSLQIFHMEIGYEMAFHSKR